MSRPTLTPTSTPTTTPATTTTRLDVVEAAYAAATGVWVGADWEHELRDDTGAIVYDGDDDDATPVYCDGDVDGDGDGREDCAVCAGARSDAAYAEDAAYAALEAARAGNWAHAAEWADEARQRALAWGNGAPWGNFATAAAATDDGVIDDEVTP